MFDNKDQFSAGPNGQYPQENSNVQPNIYVVGPQNPMGSEIGKNYRDNCKSLPSYKLGLCILTT